MKPITLITIYNNEPFFTQTMDVLLNSGVVEEVCIVTKKTLRYTKPEYRLFKAQSIFSQKVLSHILSEIRTPYFLLMPVAKAIEITVNELERMIDAMVSSRAGLVYSDFIVKENRGKFVHPLNDYQLGSVREDFNLGTILLFSTSSVQGALEKYTTINDTRYAGLYNLRLKLSIDYSIHHIHEPLYSIYESFNQPDIQKHFSYLNPDNREIQREMEIVFTDYLKKIRAYLPSNRLRMAEPATCSFPVLASIIIPVKSRKNTIAYAVESALKQETTFPFNVIVVDNHSVDGTTAVLSTLSLQHSRLIHIIPQRTDLGIGGCWNEAINHEACGKYAIQLDSDDLYSSPKALQKMVTHLQEGYAMVIGAYTLVDENLKEIPPGLIDHREWTDENGHNNALRINGLGAPRGFDTSLMRRIGFLNVSYGEDYAAGLRICREYRIGRIYENLYLCRRWSGNTDASLTIEDTNKNDAFKDSIRTAEILARQEIIRESL